MANINQRSFRIDVHYTITNFKHISHFLNSVIKSIDCELKFSFLFLGKTKT